MGSAELAGRISESLGFSDARAAMIGRTELIRASNAAALDAYKESGVVDGKSWATAGDDLVEEDCEMNEADGVIPLDDDFSSGDDAPPAHPNTCRCDISLEFSMRQHIWRSFILQEFASTAIGAVGGDVSGAAKPCRR